MLICPSIVTIVLLPTRIHMYVFIYNKKQLRHHCNVLLSLFVLGLHIISDFVASASVATATAL